MKTELVRIKSETVRELREFVLRKHGKMHGLGLEAELAIKQYIAEPP